MECPQSLCYHHAGVVVLAAVMLAALFVPVPANAHPPAMVTLQYDGSAGALNVTVTHLVDDVTTHYIYSIVIEKNGAVIQDVHYTSQTSPDTFTYQYEVPAIPGDVISATATCNHYGARSAEYTAGGPVMSQGAGSAPPLWPVHAALMVAGFVVMTYAAAIPKFFRRGRWYAMHRVTAGGGVILFTVGLTSAAISVAATGGPHLRVSHALLGAFTIAVAVLTAATGFLREHSTHRKGQLRTVHLWTGRVSIVLVIATIISGLVLTGIVGG